MKVHQIIGSLGLHGNRKIERTDTGKKLKHSKLKDCGFTEKQQAYIQEIISEMEYYNTTC